MRGHRDADGCGEAVETVAAYREPASGVEQIAGVVADVGQFEAGHGAVVGGFKLAFVFEGQRSRGVFCQAVGQRHAHSGILRHALGRQRLIVVVENPGDAQTVMQFENCDVQILKGGEFDLRPRRNLVEMRGEFGLDLVVVDAQAGLLGGPGGHRDKHQ